MKIRDFTDLICWQRGRELVLMIYTVTKKFPREEQFGLIMQLRRAIISFTSNVAEGFNRKSYKEKSQFYSVAYGSIAEIQSQLFMSKDIGYLSEEEFNRMSSKILEIRKMMSVLIKKSRLIS